MKKIKKLSDFTKNELASFIVSHHLYRFLDKGDYKLPIFQEWRYLSKLKKDFLIQQVVLLYFIEVDDDGLKLIEKNINEL